VQSLEPIPASSWASAGAFCPPTRPLRPFSQPGSPKWRSVPGNGRVLPACARTRGGCVDRTHPRMVAARWRNETRRRVSGLLGGVGASPTHRISVADVWHRPCDYLL
jgi:hypothetical protein